MTGAPEGEAPAGSRWVSVVVEAEEDAMGDPAEEGDLSSVVRESPLDYSTTELRFLNVPVPPDATVSPSAHPSVRHRTRWHCCRGVTQTGAASGAASAAAASVGGVAPGGWRTASRWTGPRTHRTPPPGRRGRHQAYGDQTLHSFAAGVHQSFPRRGTLFKKSRGRVHGLCAYIQPERLTKLTANTDLPDDR